MIVCRVKMKSFPTSGKESGSGHWKLSVTGTMFVSICKAVESSCRKLSSSSTFLISLGEELDWNWLDQDWDQDQDQDQDQRKQSFKNLLLTRSKALGGKMRRKCWISCNWKKRLSGKCRKFKRCLEMTLFQITREDPSYSPPRCFVQEWALEDDSPRTLWNLVGEEF